MTGSQPEPSPLLTASRDPSCPLNSIFSSPILRIRCSRFIRQYQKMQCNPCRSERRNPELSSRWRIGNNAASDHVICDGQCGAAGRSVPLASRSPKWCLDSHATNQLKAGADKRNQMNAAMLSALREVAEDGFNGVSQFLNLVPEFRHHFSRCFKLRATSRQLNAFGNAKGVRSTHV